MEQFNHFANEVIEAKEWCEMHTQNTQWGTVPDRIQELRLCQIRDHCPRWSDAG